MLNIFTNKYYILYTKKPVLALIDFSFYLFDCTECVTKIRTNRTISLNKMFLMKN